MSASSSPNENGRRPTPAWVDTDRDRPSARRAGWSRHPLLTAVNLLQRRRGNSRRHPVPDGAGEVLRRVGELPISVWSYGYEHDSVRHLGPMAQDFAAAFGLGDSDRDIALVDASGVALASVQALLRRVEALEQALVTMLEKASVGEHTPEVAGGER